MAKRYDSAAFYRHLQENCYAGPLAASASASGKEQPVENAVNDTLTGYIMDNLSQYVYPNLLCALLLQSDSEQGRTLVAQSYRQLGHRIELRALQRASTDLDLQMRYAEQSGNASMLKSLRRARQLAAERNGRLRLARNGYPHLTLLLEQSNLLRNIGGAQSEQRDGSFTDQWRASLLAHIQSMCAVLDDYEIVKGTGEPRSREREQFADNKNDWSEACYRQDKSKAEKIGVLYDTDDLDVLRGRGRLVTLKSDAFGDERDTSYLRRLFLAFPDCFLFDYIPAQRGAASERTALANLRKSDRFARPPADIIVFTLSEPHLVQRTNRVLPAGHYRIDRTIFLLTKGGNRSVAVRSNFCERDGTLRYAERHYARANFDGRAPVVRTRYAGTANLFFAVSRKPDVRGLLGFWVGSLTRSTHIGGAAIDIQHNGATSPLRRCQLRNEVQEYTRIVLRSVPAISGAPAHVVVSLQTDSESAAAAHSVLYNGLSVEYLCAAQPSRFCPPKEGVSKAKFGARHQSVGAFLFLYALVYYSKYSLKALTLFARAWAYEEDRRQYMLVSGSIANYYNANFGLSFVPLKVRSNALDSKERVREKIEEEIGWTYMRRKYADAFRQTWTLDNLLNTHSEFCHFYTLLKRVEDSRGNVDLQRVTSAPLFESNYYFQAVSEDELREQNILSDGFMFRHYPHLAELEMRVVDLYLGLLQRRLQKEPQAERASEWRRERRWYRSPSTNVQYRPRADAVAALVANPTVNSEFLENNILAPDRRRRSRHDRPDDSEGESGAACSFGERKQNLLDEAAIEVQRLATESSSADAVARSLSAEKKRRAEGAPNNERKRRDSRGDSGERKKPSGESGEQTQIQLQESAIGEQRVQAQSGDFAKDDRESASSAAAAAANSDRPAAISKVDKASNSDEEEETYEVERIVGHKDTREGRRYTVKWQGYAESDNTDEPLSNLWNAIDFIYDYHKERGVEPDAEAKGAFQSYCRDWHGWKWSKNSCAHDSVLVAMLAPETYNPLRDDLMLDTDADNAQIARLRARLRKAWRDIRHPTPSETCWSLRTAFAREFPDKADMLSGGQFIGAATFVDFCFDNFVAQQPFVCKVTERKENGDKEGLVTKFAQESAHPRFFVLGDGTFADLVRRFFAVREKKVEGERVREQRIAIDSAQAPLRYLFIEKDAKRNEPSEVLHIETVSDCKSAKIGSPRRSLAMHLTALVAHAPAHFVCAFRCLDRWFHYDDSPGGAPRIEPIGSFDDLLRFNRQFYQRKTIFMYYVRAEQ